MCQKKDGKLSVMEDFSWKGLHLKVFISCFSGNYSLPFQKYVKATGLIWINTISLWFSVILLGLLQL